MCILAFDAHTTEHLISSSRPNVEGFKSMELTSRNIMKGVFFQKSFMQLSDGFGVDMSVFLILSTMFLFLICQKYNLVVQSFGHKITNAPITDNTTEYNIFVTKDILILIEQIHPSIYDMVLRLLYVDGTVVT